MHLLQETNVAALIQICNSILSSEARNAIVNVCSSFLRFYDLSSIGGSIGQLLAISPLHAA